MGKLKHTKGKQKKLSALDLFYMLKSNPKALMRKLMHLPIKKFFKHGVQFRFLLNAAIVLGSILFF